jgi:hypothetical protein
MMKVNKEIQLNAYTNKGQLVASEVVEYEPRHKEVEQFANGYQQADYVKVEEVYKYV